jgi:hypothetical protein
MIASASPPWISRVAIPIAVPPLAQAVLTAKLGPSQPWRSARLPAAELNITMGTVKAEIAPGPSLCRRPICSSWVAIPPIVVPTMQPTRSGEYGVPFGPQMASASASWTAAAAR